MHEAKTNSSTEVPFKPPRRFPRRPLSCRCSAATFQRIPPTLIYTDIPCRYQPGRSFSLSQAFKRSTQLGKALRASSFIHDDYGPSSPRLPFDPRKIKTEARRTPIPGYSLDILNGRFLHLLIRITCNYNNFSFKIFQIRGKFSFLKTVQ